VLRLHQDLRGADQQGARMPGADPRSSGADRPDQTPLETKDPRLAARLRLPEAASALSDRVESLERALTVGQEELRDAADRTERVSRRGQVALLLLSVGIIAAIVVGFRLQRQVETRLNEAAARVTAARQEADTATQSIASVRQDAELRIAEARQTASKAETVTNVLAAPDLVRYNLVGGNAAARVRAQVLWSRSRGLVFSASRLPAPQANATYQIWLLTSGKPVSAGLFAPDSRGGVTFAREALPTVPQAVMGFSVTVEPIGGSEAPSGAIVLARAPEPPA
jgi:prefoldin subunit 5